MYSEIHTKYTCINALCGQKVEFVCLSGFISFELGVLNLVVCIHWILKGVF
jgi:hypothetical protein